MIELPQIYAHIIERFNVHETDEKSLGELFAKNAEWLESPGCLFQRNNSVLGSRIRTEGVIKAGVFVTVVLKGTGQGGPRGGAAKFHYADNSVVAMALREPTEWTGNAPKGAKMVAAGVAFPKSSIEGLGLGPQFQDLFLKRENGVFVTSFRAPPRILAVAGEMLSPGVDGQARNLLMSAHATELLVRVLSAMSQRVAIDTSTDRNRGRFQSVKDAIDADLRRTWTIQDLAQLAGTSRRSLNLQFRRYFGMTASDYLRTQRMTTARDAIIQQGLSVNEVAYLVGYGNPANFATAFRKHFGYAPSSCRFQP